MKISASIFSNKDDSIIETVKNIEKLAVDFLHIDCNDDIAVFDSIKKIKEITELPIDLHLISSKPENYYDIIKKYNIEQVTFQYENLENNFQIPENIAKKIGIAITNDTPVSIFEKFKEKATHILLMTTVPGQSGGSFNKLTFSKIRQFRNKFPNKEIFVDGGVNDKVSFILRNMGVHTAVIGSFLFKDKPYNSILKLQSNEISSNFTAADFMLEFEEIPVLYEKNFTFLELLQTIEKYGFGLAIVSDKSHNFKGLITNADIRRGLIKFFEQMPNINPDELINRKPVVVNEQNTVEEIIKHIKKQTFPIQFLPVVDNNNKIKGLLRFNNLIKGEL